MAMDTIIRVAGGGVLEFDSSDALSVEARIVREPVPDGDDGAGNAKFRAGDAVLDLHITFKPGTAPRWTEGG